MDIADVILNLRKEQALTQQQLAEKAGIDSKSIQRIELGKVKNPTGDTRMKLAKALGVDIKVLTSECATKKSTPRKNVPGNKYYVVKDAGDFLNAVAKVGAFHLLCCDDISPPIVDRLGGLLCQCAENWMDLSVKSRTEIAREVESCCDELSLAGYQIVQANVSRIMKTMGKEVEYRILDIKIISQKALGLRRILG